MSGSKDPGIASLELARGDVLLCGSGRFGTTQAEFGCQADSRDDFNLAMALLHSFEYTEAEKAFVKVLDSDPACAMAYWGIAMSNFHPLWTPPTREELTKGSKILELARNLRSSPREMDYLDALGAFYEDWEGTDHRTRTLRFEKKMAALHKKYDTDTEAAILYALSLNAAADPADKTFTRQRKAGNLLEQLFPAFPEHPGIAHYIIHNYDYPELAIKALPTARRYARIAPASAHAQHMPSHIFIRLGLWDEAIRSNQQATESARCYSERIQPGSHWDEELHGMDYLVYAYLQQGDTGSAVQQYEYLKSFTQISPVNFKVAYAAAAIPSRLALESHNWEEAAALEFPLATSIPWDNFPWQKSILLSAKTIGLIKTGNIPEARKILEEIGVLHTQLSEKADTYSALQVEIQQTILKAWMAWAAGETDAAVQLMENAVLLESETSKHPVTPGEIIPAGEHLGELFVALGETARALSAYESDLRLHPNRFNSLYGAFLAARTLSLTEKTVFYGTKVLDATAGGPGTRPGIQEVLEYVRQQS